MPRPVPDPLWSRVDKTGACWTWTGRRNAGGYGVLRIRGRSSKILFAHRLAWELTNGPIPDGLFVCHHCDNPPCCNPEHLFVGTPKDNCHDMMAKGRHCPRKPAAVKARSRSERKRDREAQRRGPAGLYSVEVTVEAREVVPEARGVPGAA